MINRKLIRIKAVQLTYAYFQNGNHNIDNAEKELIFSLSKAYHLYNYLLLLIVSLTKIARKQYEGDCARAAREGSDLPSSKFVNNKFELQLENNDMLREFNEEQKRIWDDNIEFVRKLFLQIEQCEAYKEYLASKEDDYEADRELWRKLYRQFIQDNDDLSAVLEEISLYWNDDKDVVDTFVLKTIKRFTEKSSAKEPLLPEYKDEEDREFARKLFRACVLNADQYQRYMSEASLNWDFLLEYLWAAWRSPLRKCSTSLISLSMSLSMNMWNWQNFTPLLVVAHTSMVCLILLPDILSRLEKCIR